jgi:Beta-lactamase enzyme family
MKIRTASTAGAVVALALFTTFGARAQTPTTEAQILLAFCLAHPEACSISIDYTKDGRAWHIDYQGTRLNVLASSIKVVHLMTYADAVDRRQIVPGQAIPLNTWAQFWIGRDGGSLAAVYAANGNPATITNDQIVAGMMQQSDDAAPDYLLNKLGWDAFADVIERYIAGPGRVGSHDPLQSIYAGFANWWGNPASPNSGIAALMDYSGIASDEYRAAVDQVFARMHDANYVNAIRQYEGIQLPWQTGTPPAGHAPPLSELQYEQLEKGYSMRSNTRTYNQFMLGLLHRNLLSPGAQAIVEKFLEYRLSLTTKPGLLAYPLSHYMTRYGAKDGSLATNAGTTVRTRTIYAEGLDGTQVVFTVHLAGTPGTATDLGAVPGPLGSLDSAISYFAIAMVTDPAFAAQVEFNLGAQQDVPAPSLIARVVENNSTSRRVRLKVKIENVGTLPTFVPLSMGMFVAGKEVARQHFQPLRPGETAEVDLDSGELGVILSFELAIDPANLIPASQKQDNPQFEINLGH